MIERTDVHKVLAKSSHKAPTKKFFVLEDDSHSAEGMSYLGYEGDEILPLLKRLLHVGDWLYEIYRTDSFKRCCTGMIFAEASIEDELELVDPLTGRLE